MAGKSTRLLLPAEEIEGDRQGTVDFVFCRIGEPVSLKPTNSDSAFDLSNPPFQPLVVSERHRLLFLAHTEGFLVANTKDVIGLAKGAKGKDTCVQSSSVVDVQIGRVSIVALSGDNSMLAATVGGEIHLFYVQSLLDKVQVPAISGHLSDSGIVKDLKWRRNSENSFVVLSSHGLLCHGSSDLQLKDVMDNVDAVDWSVDGKFVAIARQDTVSILASNFEEILGIPLLFQSWAIDSGSTIKVDSLKWVRHDSIILGCTQLNEDGDEDGYLVQVIASGEHKFTEVSCKPIVFSFHDLFEGLSVDMLPTGAGPYLLANYLDCWDVAITSNKKNIDQHISLLKWLVEDNKYEVVSLELGSDKYIPRIDLQDDGDDNLILGLAVDKSSLSEKIKIQSDMEFKELSPRCILLCLTCDGKLILNHVAWVSEPSDLPKMVSPLGDDIANEVFGTVSSAENKLEVTTSMPKDGLEIAISDKMHLIPGKYDIGGKIGSHGTLDGYSSAIEESRMPSNAGDLGTKSTDFKKSNDSMMVKETGTGKIVSSDITAGSTFGSRTQKIFGVDGSNASVSSTVKGSGTGRRLGLSINEGSSFATDAADAKHLLSSPGESNSTGIGNKVLFSLPSTSTPNFAPFSKPFGTLASSEKINQTGMQTFSSKSGYTGSASTFHDSSVTASTKLPGSKQQLLANSTSSKPHQRLESESQFSKQFYNVKVMAKELDALLSSIECEGGFKDLCTVFLEKSLLALEAGLDHLSEVLFVYRDKIENQHMKIQQLSNKMLEVSAKQVYMKGIVQQASDHRYWAFWNSQKLSPEFEAKRSHISNLKQNLTNQLIELERHFNSLEINKFGEYSTTSTGRKVPYSSATSRQTQSLHSLYSTVNSQLAVAEQLSERLSKQMAVLNISSPTSDKRNVTKELFESIGLDPKTHTFMSPDLKSYKQLPPSSKRTSLSPATALKEQSWNDAPSAMKAIELESVRRKRDSLDRSWAHFEPSKTTIKRTSTKEHVRSNLDVAFREAKETFDSQVKAFDIAQKASMNNPRTPSKPFDSQTQGFGITKRSSSGTESFLSKTASLERSPSKGIQEKCSKKAIDNQSKSIFKWAKDPSDLHSEPNTSFTSTSSQASQNTGTPPPSFAAASIFSKSNINKDEKLPFMLNMGASSTTNDSSSSSTSSQISQSAGTQPSSFAAPSIFGNTNINKDGKLPFMLNMGALSTTNVSSFNSTSSQISQSAGTQPSSFAAPSTFSHTNINKDEKSSFLSKNSGNSATKTASASKPTTSFSTQMKFSSSVSPLKTASVAATRSQLDQGSTLKDEVDTLSSSAQTSTKNSTITSSSTLSASIAQTTSSSTSLSSSSFQFGNSMQPNIFLSPSKSKIGSELEHTTSESTNNAAVDDAPKVLSSLPSSKLTLETSQASVSDNVVGTGDMNHSKSQQVISQNPAMAMSSSIMASEKDESLDANLSQEDDMEEEALDTGAMLNFGSLGDFSLQSAPSSDAQKANPFGSSFSPAMTGSSSPQLSWSVSPGQLFRPSSFNLPQSQSPQLSQSTGASSLTGGIPGGFSGFGQPAQLGAGQQALGSVLGSFGQSRQLGSGSPGFGFASAVGSSGGFSNASGFTGAATGGGFAGAATGGGFAGAAMGGGFAGAATGGGFAGAATGGGFTGASTNMSGFAGAGAGGGFAGVPSSGGGFAAGGGFGGAATSGGGFATGGFGGFSSFQGSGFSAFGSGNSSAGRPPAELLTQMRK